MRLLYSRALVETGEFQLNLERYKLCAVSARREVVRQHGIQTWTS